ncbi:unnamed protein product [Rotaria magnacalcarata]|uniref:Uncharacterized protein n=3 Tax=Rotaria magnacalcarata TaxID=392030 RepID=A0A8S2RJ13_9BILA|nr:unnamed protein product [Rotaria magnacalcarata]
MGVCSSAIDSPPIADDELMNEITSLINEVVVSIPSEYAILKLCDSTILSFVNSLKKKRIVEEMRRASPEPYKNLLYEDYPEKNADRVKAMALEKIMSKEAKNRIREEVNQKLEPKISEKTANMNPIASKLTRKAIIAVVDEAINKAVDKVVNETVDHIMLGKTDKFKQT